MEQLVARRAHNPKVGGSNPSPATNKATSVAFFMKEYTVYVIESKEGYHYTGLTEDIKIRIKQHNDKSLSF